MVFPQARLVLGRPRPYPTSAGLPLVGNERAGMPRAASYRLLVPVFGDQVLGYHLVLLAIHYASVALVWLLAKRLNGEQLVAAVAAMVFAVHPAGIEAVTWISSLNSVGLPLSLGAWLAFVVAVERPGQRVS